LLINDDRWPHWTGDRYIELKYIVKRTGRARKWPLWAGDHYTTVTVTAGLTVLIWRESNYYSCWSNIKWTSSSSDWNVTRSCHDIYEELLTWLLAIITLSLTFTGLPCLGQFTSDNCWYRGLIIDVNHPHQQLTVLYVDYGNSEVITYDR
jgi:hypothetical protein